MCPCSPPATKPAPDVANAAIAGSQALAMQVGRIVSQSPLAFDYAKWPSEDQKPHIGQIVWNGQPLAQDLQAHYGYDGSTHRLELTQLQVAQGRYQASGTLQAQAPMALDVQAQGQVHTTTPAGQDLVLQAQARLQGPLAGADALLRLQARLQPDTAHAPTTHSTAQIDATVAPWAAQPLRQADLAPDRMPSRCSWRETRVSVSR